MLIICINAPEWECEYWLNINDPTEGFRPLDALIRQERLNFVIVGPTKERKFVINYNLVSHLKPMREILKGTSWTMEDFDVAKASLQAKYSLEELKELMPI